MLTGDFVIDYLVPIYDESFEIMENDNPSTMFYVPYNPSEDTAYILYLEENTSQMTPVDDEYIF